MIRRREREEGEAEGRDGCEREGKGQVRGQKLVEKYRKGKEVGKKRCHVFSYDTRVELEYNDASV